VGRDTAFSEKGTPKVHVDQASLVHLYVLGKKSALAIHDGEKHRKGRR
jgi:hypothetical protein